MLIITPSQGLDALRWAGPHVLLSMTPMDNSALPKHHMNSWSLICEATRCVLTVSCLHFRHLHVIFLPSKQSFFGVVLQGYWIFSLFPALSSLSLSGCYRQMIPTHITNVFTTDYDSLGNQKLVHFISLAKCRKFN